MAGVRKEINGLSAEPEGPTTPNPPDDPPPPPDPGGLTPSSPITVTTDNRTIDSLSFSATTSNGPQGSRTIFIFAQGTASVPIDNLTITNCTFSGGTIAIWLRHVTNVTIENCTIEDPDYAGVDLWSCITGSVAGNTIRRVGYTRTDFSDGAFGNNAYGIVLNRNESSSLVTDPHTELIVVDNNLIEDVPLWMGMNGHGGVDNTWSNNIVRRCPRAFFNAGSPGGGNPSGIIVTANRLEHPVTKTGGTSDIEGVLYSHWTGGSITNNQIDHAFGGTGYFDYQGASSGVTISGNSTF